MVDAPIRQIPIKVRYKTKSFGDIKVMSHPYASENYIRLRDMEKIAPIRVSY